MIDDTYVSGTVEDLTTLSKLDENILLQELKARYENKLIYTYIGDILIAINPFCNTGLYERDVIKKYCYTKKSENPPHIFAIADVAYQNIVEDNLLSSNNQCILISGESGAGKTESTKLIIRQLMTLCDSRSQLEQQIIQVNPLLESFGNAQTLMNDNSSRFGKYIQLKFIDGVVKGGKISEYLLEKSRVVFQNKGELNFHIFYYIFAGLSEEQKEKLLLKNCDSFRYAEKCMEIVKADLSVLQEKYTLLCDAMDWVGFTNEEQSNIFRAISAVLYIGNITFKVEESKELTVVDNENVLQSVSTLLEINAEDLKKALTSMIVNAANEIIEKNYTIEKAEDSRDAMAKVIYSRLFSWIVYKVNSLIKLEDSLEKQDIKEIGILDIFGFEHFQNNSFEQACINLANEQLQFFFNKYVFQLEQEEYKKEGIDWKEIKFLDNQPLLNLFMEKPGLISILDDETQFPKATDATYVQKLIKSFQDNAYFVTKQGFSAKQFTIKHYAAQVTYNSNNWLEKNRDTQPAEILNILKNSNNMLIKMLFSGHIKRTGTFNPEANTCAKDLNLKETHNLDKVRKLTVGTQFKNSLIVLMEKMGVSDPIFIRCLKPNHERKANIFDEKYVLTQLKYTGVLETTKIRRDGFAVRPTFPEFVSKYNVLIDLSLPNTKESCLKILKKCKTEGFQVGKTRVFLKYSHIGQLDEEMTTVNTAAVHMQRVARGFVARKKYKNLKEKKIKYEMDLVKFTDSIKLRGDQVYEEIEATNKYNRYDKTNNPEKYLTLENAQSAKSNALEQDLLDIKASQHKTYTSSLKSVDWFVKTQVDEVKNTSGDFALWFHGIISRSKSEELLENCCLGAFLIRVSESRFGYTLSIRDKVKFRHYMIDYLPNGKYVILGEPKPHQTLNDLIKYHQKNKISNWDYLLTDYCKRDYECSSCDDILYEYVGYLELGKWKKSKEITPPTLPNRTYKSKSADVGKKKETSKKLLKENLLQTSTLEKLKKGFKGLLE